MESQSSLNKPLIDQQTSNILQNYATMKAQNAAKAISQSLKREGKLEEGGELLGLGSTSAFMAAKGIYESKPIQTGIQYGKQFVSDYEKGGYDFATNSLKSTLRNKLAEAIEAKKAELQTRLNDQAENIQNDISTRVQNAQDNITNEFENARQNIEANADDAVNTVNSAINNTVNDGVNMANDGVNSGLNQATDLTNQVNSGMRTLPDEQGLAGDLLGNHIEASFTRASQLGNELSSNLSETSQNLASASRTIFNNANDQLLSETNPVSSFMNSLFTTPRQTATRANAGPVDEEFDTDSIIGQQPTDTVGDVATGAEAGADIGDATTGLLELASGLAATDVLAPIGGALALGALGYSAYEGLKDMFSDSDDDEAPSPNRNEGPVMQLGS